MFRTLSIAAAVATAVVVYGIGSLSAQSDVIAERQALMKQAGEATRTATQIARGELPFDEAKTQEIFNVYLMVAEKAPALFPEGSDTPNTTAAPAVWVDNAAFNAELAKFGELAKQGLAIKDLESFKTAFAAIGKQCGACHQTFRVKREG